MAVILGTNLNDVILGSSFHDEIDGLLGDDVVIAGAENDVVLGNDGNDVIAGGDGNDSLYGGKGNDAFYGDSGNDYIEGGEGDDTLDGGIGADQVRGGSGNDALRSDSGADLLFGDSGDDRFVITGNGITSGAFGDVLISDSSGIDTIDLSLAQSAVRLNLNNGSLVGSFNRVDGQQFIFGGGDSVDGGAYVTVIENAVLTSFDDYGLGNSANNKIEGGDGNDIIFGAEGNDELIGGAGADKLIGDIDIADATYLYETISGPGTNATVENLSVLSRSASAGTGLRLQVTFDVYVPDAVIDPADPTSVIEGTASFEVQCFVNGLAARLVMADTELGSIARDISDTVPDTGAPDVQSYAFVFDLIGLNASANDDIEIRVVGASYDPATETASESTLSARATIQHLTYTFGNDTLNGGTGVGTDTLYGGLGNDTYVVEDSTFDAIAEYDGEGTDTVQSSVSYILPFAVENLTLTGAASEATGNLRSNILTGNAANNRLDGRGGVDTMIGGLGNDTYVVETSGDIVSELANQGTDTVEASFTYILTANVENLTLTGFENINGTGNTLDNVLRGNNGSNVLNGGLGNDMMEGGFGNDVYYVQQTGDIVTEASASGGSVDLVYSYIANYTLTNNVENLTLVAGTNGTGNTLNNVITGNTLFNVLTGGLGNDTLNGGIGGDSMIGGVGNDKYFVDSSLDFVTELVAQGTDEVSSTISYTLGANIENLTLTGAIAINGTGNTLNNVITGNSAANFLTGGDGNDTLVGGLGADTMDGGLGNDVFVVDSALDVLIDAGGVDRVEAAFSYVLGANIENLTLTGALSINATGNALSNLITGNAGSNRLDGLGGADIMIGGFGNDTYFVDQIGEVVTELAFQGADTVNSSVTYTLGLNVENLVLSSGQNINGTGNLLDNKLTGNSGNNILNGLGGADTMLGLLGDDIYFVDSILDVVSEAGGGGTDTVHSSIDYVLQTGIENLVLTGAALNGTGNTSSNVITGTSGANILNGLAGADTMIGGVGNDTYYVDNTADLTLETSGIDTVFASVSYTLLSGIENLDLTGVLGLNGTGNTLGNNIVGNIGANRLNGLAGADTLTGGIGADRFVFTTAISVTDTITDFQVGIDDIEVSVAAFGGLVAGSPVSLVSGSVPTPSGAGPQFLYDSDDGRLGFDRDGFGAAFAPVIFARLTDAPAITAGDFVVVA